MLRANEKERGCEGLGTRGRQRDGEKVRETSRERTREKEGKEDEREWVAVPHP